MSVTRMTAKVSEMLLAELSDVVGSRRADTTFQVIPTFSRKVQAESPARLAILPHLI
jgi:hypothetical protein